MQISRLSAKMQFTIIIPFLLLQVCLADRPVEVTLYVGKHYTGLSGHKHAVVKKCYRLPSELKKSGVMSVHFTPNQKGSKLVLTSEAMCQGTKIFLNESIANLDKVGFGKRTASMYYLL